MAKVNIKFQTAKETAENWLIIAYYFYFDGNIWEKIHFYVVYICNKMVEVESVLHLIL